MLQPISLLPAIHTLIPIHVHGLVLPDIQLPFACHMAVRDVMRVGSLHQVLSWLCSACCSVVRLYLNACTPHSGRKHHNVVSVAIRATQNSARSNALASNGQA